jgi:phosphatidylinositol alpha-1,6-mannosyltransferase
MVSSRWLFIHPFQLRLQRGIEVYLWNLAFALAENGIAVDILTWDGPLSVPDYVQHSGIRLFRVPSVRYFQEIFAIPFYVFRLLKGNCSHVFVHFAGYGEGLALRLARLIRPVNFSVVFHFPRSLVPHRYQEFVRWGFQRDAVHLIAVSRATASEVEQWANRPCDVIGHGVDTQHFRPNAGLRENVRQKFGLGQDTPVLISVAALEERKGIQWVIQAMPSVLRELPTTQYWVLGEGPHRVELERQVCQLGLQNSVLFKGFQPDVADYLAASDIALMLSRGEASSFSVLEAAAFGLPVISSCNEPFPELIQPDWGQMVLETDPQQVSQAILACLSDCTSRKSKGLQARRYVVEHHQWQQVARQYHDLMTEVR